MKFSTATLLTILGGLVSVEAGCTLDNGNYYCSKTSKISYANVGYSGSYKDVTNMDESSGECTQESVSFSGNLSPLDEELSVHFRGPLKLLQFAVYYPTDDSSSKKKREDCDEVQYHAHHKHKRATDVVEVTHTVVVDGKGNTINQATTTSTQATTSSTKAADTETSTTSTKEKTSTSTTAGSSSSSASSEDESEDEDEDVEAGDWERVAYYTPGSTTNVTFLNYYGGSGSGVWSSTFGNSLSYANSDATGGSSEAVALEETTTESDNEYIIFSGSECDGDDCGYYREGIPAYHGFGGNKKIFVFEFEMPTATDSVTNNHDMPAIWLLNAKIPRTLQYGEATCSCWKTGCGELDLFEVLLSGSDKLISHIHDGQGNDGTSTGGGGSQDYFERPTDSSMKAAVVFDGEDITLIEIDSDIESSISASLVSKWIAASGSKATLSS